MSSSLLPSRRASSWLAGLVVGTLLVGIAVALGSFTTGQRWTAGPGARFVPADGVTSSVRLDQGETSGAAMQQSSRLRGALVADAMSRTASLSLPAPADGLASAAWWREALIPDDPAQSARYRIYSADQQGVWLRVQDWEAHGLSLDGFLALPADVDAGRTWTSSGLALASPTTRQLTYRATSTASAPTDPARVTQGCLSVAADTVLEGGDRTRRWRETTLWCPGAGAVEQTGDQDGFTYELAPGPAAQPPTLTPPSWDTRDVASWEVRTPDLIDGDQTFGADRADLLPAQPPALTSTGTLVFSLIDGADLTGLEPLRAGSLWWHWWVRPGGQVTTVAATGPLVVATTTDRRVSAYTAGGTLVWTVPLDDVAVVPAVRVGPDAVAVATVGGQVSVFDLRTGEVRWRRQLTRGVHNPIVSDGSVVVAADTGPSVTAWDATTGQQRWSIDAGSTYQTPLVVHGDVVAVVGGAITGYDVRTGARRWTHDPGVGLGQVTGAGDQLWVGRNGALESWSMADGTRRWTRPGAESASAAGSGCTPDGSVRGLVLTGSQLAAVDASGRDVHAWPLDLAGDLVDVACGGSGVVVSSYAGNGSTSLRVQTIGAS